MPTYIALPRAVNVGGSGKLPMADFREMLAQLGFRNVETYIQSGNAVFDAPGSSSVITKSVSTALAKFMGKPVPVLVRTRDELTRVLAANPFADEAEADGARVHAVFLSAHPAKDSATGLERIVTQYPARRDRYHLAGDTLYLHLPDGAADSKFTAVALDRILGVTATARNWNTVLKLHAMAQR